MLKRERFWKERVNHPAGRPSPGLHMVSPGEHPLRPLALLCGSSPLTRKWTLTLTPLRHRRPGARVLKLVGLHTLAGSLLCENSESDDADKSSRFSDTDRGSCPRAIDLRVLLNPEAGPILPIRPTRTPRPRKLRHSLRVTWQKRGGSGSRTGTTGTKENRQGGRPQHLGSVLATGISGGENERSHKATATKRGKVNLKVSCQVREGKERGKHPSERDLGGRPCVGVLRGETFAAGAGRGVCVGNVCNLSPWWCVGWRCPELCSASCASHVRFCHPQALGGNAHDTQVTRQRPSDIA